MKVAINGFGRIGRLILRLALENDMDVVAINDLGSSDDLAYLLKYDSSFRNISNFNVSSFDDYLIVNNHKIRTFKEIDPAVLPWGELGIDIVFECTGKFTSYDGAYKHIEAGAKKVLISAPGKGDMKTIVYNVNHDILDGSEQVISTASCTTNCLAPVIKVLNDNFEVIGGAMSTIHAYTNDQVLLDSNHKKGIASRRGRAGALNIIPTSTGACKAIGKVLPFIDGKLEGNSFRVPVGDGSLVDLTLEVKKPCTNNDINNAFLNNKNETIGITFDPIVSSDIIGNRLGSLVDGSLTKSWVVDGKNFVKVIAWYDNEMGYSAQMIRTAKYINNLK